jgi:hypothetical protein
MLETQKLPLFFGEGHATSNADPLLGRRQYEIRALSSVYLPEQAIARIENDALLVEYRYNTDERPERPAFAFESGAGFSIQFGQKTHRVLSLAVKATRPEVFATNMDACANFLKKQLGSASEQRNYLIVADSLAVFKRLVLREYYRK